MAINKIIKFNLEEHANKLKAQGLSDYKIAEELSKIAGVKITRSTVYRYFSSNHDPVIQHVKHREEIVTKTINGRIDAVKANNKITPGIKAVTPLIESDRLYVHTSCQNTINEFQMYRYDDNDKETPLTPSY